MSICKYRLIEKRLQSLEKWIVWGTLYDNCSGDFPGSSVLIRALPDDDRHIRRYFRRRIETLAIELEDGERIIGEEYAGRFRLRPGLFTVEGETHKEIRQQLWERIFAPPGVEPIPDAPAEEPYVTRPVYHAVREAEEPEESR